MALINDEPIRIVDSIRRQLSNDHLGLKAMLHTGSTLCNLGIEEMTDREKAVMLVAIETTLDCVEGVFVMRTQVS